MTIRIKLNGQLLEVLSPVTILKVCEANGIFIPSLCFLNNHEHFTSCLVCVVKIKGKDWLSPACGTIVEDGMEIETDSEEVRQARKTAIDLLLSEHNGDCLSPCQRACPQQLNIPLIIRLILKQEFKTAYKIINEASPDCLSSSKDCNLACEKACRRKRYDQPLKISLLLKFLKDAQEKYLKAVPSMERNNLKAIQPEKKEGKRFDSVMRKLSEVELAEFMRFSSRENQVQPFDKESGYNQTEVFKEAQRCLYCDCQKQDNCQLRNYADIYLAKQITYKGDRPDFERIVTDSYTLERGKCIKCGICMKLSEKEGVKFGFTFLNRGFDLKIGVPLDKYNNEQLRKVIDICIEKCPTGALSKTLKIDIPNQENLR